MTLLRKMRYARQSVIGNRSLAYLIFLITAIVIYFDYLLSKVKSLMIRLFPQSPEGIFEKNSRPVNSSIWLIVRWHLSIFISHNLSIWHDSISLVAVA